MLVLVFVVLGFFLPVLVFIAFVMALGFFLHVLFMLVRIPDARLNYSHCTNNEAIFLYQCMIIYN